MVPGERFLFQVAHGNSPNLTRNISGLGSRFGNQISLTYLPDVFIRLSKIFISGKEISRLQVGLRHLLALLTRC